MDASVERDVFAQTRVYVWKHVFFLQARSQTVNRSDHPTRRLTAGLIVANRHPVRLKVNHAPLREYEAALLGPNVLRETFEAVGSDFTIVDIDIASPAYEAIAPRVTMGEVQELSPREILRLRSLLVPRFLQMFSCAEIQALFDSLVHVISESSGHVSCRRDPRVYKTIDLIDRLPLNEISLNRLALHACLSESRLRHLFRKQMDCTLSQYARWASVRKALDNWKPGTPFSAATDKAGFYDPAHFNHAMKEHFAVTPSAMVKDPGMDIIKCEGC
jgi:AraC-like DNA-binding protein